MKVAIIGESCKDVFVYGKVERLEPAAPVPIVQAVDTVVNGGMAMNVAKNIAALGVDYDIYTNPTWESITKTRIVEQKTNHMFLRMDSGETKYGRCTLGDIDFKKYEAIIVSDYNKGFLSKSDIQHIINQHSLVFLDTKKPIGKWCEGATFIKINKSEFNNAGQLTKKVKSKVIITLGPKGAMFQGETYPVSEAQVKDLSGAGDTFLAGLVKEYIQTKDITKAIKYANECASVVVQKRGVSII